MAAPVLVRNRIHVLDTPETTVEDKTSLGKVSLCCDARRHILWDRYHFYWAAPEGTLNLMNYGKSNFTEHVIVTDGEKPGRIRIFEKELPREEGVPPIEWTLEINTQLIAFRVLNPTQLDLTSLAPGRSFVPFYIARDVEEKTTSDPVTVALVASFHGIDESGLSAEQVSLLNGIVNGSTSETEEHRNLLVENGRYREVYDLKMQRVHRFQEGVPLYDCTKDRLAGIVYLPAPDCKEEITLKGIPVLNHFQKDEGFIGMPFSRTTPGFANYVIVRDGANDTVIIERVEVLRPGSSTIRKEVHHVDLKDSNKVPRHPQSCHCGVKPDSRIVYGSHPYKAEL